MSVTAPVAPRPIALITGGSRGIGRATALTLAERGVDSVITFRTGEREAAGVVELIRSRGGKAVALRLDVGQVAGFEPFSAELRRSLRETWNREEFDYLVNNAGRAAMRPSRPPRRACSMGWSRCTSRAPGSSRRGSCR